jgi:hypothetical protein
MADSAIADVTAEPASVAVIGDILRANIRLSTDQKVVLTGAALIDKTGRAYELAGPVAGIRQDQPGGCVVAGLLAPRQLVSLTFKAVGADPPFSLILELQSPDQSEPTGCRTTGITVDDLK